MIRAVLSKQQVTAGLPAPGCRVKASAEIWTLALPPLTDEGELPAGVHQTSLSEVRALFGVGSARRQTLILRLERIYRAALARLAT